MKRTILWRCGLGLAALTAVYAWQRPFREYPGIEYNDFPLPQDYKEKTEWAFARLMYPQSSMGYGRNFGSRRGGDWREGNSMWTQDYPRADRHFSLAMRRLSRIHARSTEQPVNLDDGDEIYNWPWLYAVQVGEWGLTEPQAKKLRDYLLRGGFFMADDFHGSEEQAYFENTMKMVFPERPIVDIPNDDPIFHTLYDLDDRYRITGAEHLAVGYKLDGKVARWEGIYDDKGRVMIAISLNSDIGDSWEWSNDPRYPQKFSDLGIRIGVNYVVYAMTH